MMVLLWLSIMVLALLIAVGSAVIALRLHYQMLDKTRQEREAWQQAQEGRQRTWEVRQGKHILEAEKKLADQLKELRNEWRDWHIEAETRIEIEQELARLPHIEDVEVSANARAPRQQPDRWQPPMFYRANLAGRDLSYRYMGRADLREAQLAGANLYMTDLTGASLAGANLERANLVGANLSGADLREADLSGANFMVTDLHNAALHGAVLLDARNLSPEQLHTALYDETTRIGDLLTVPQEPAASEQPALAEARSAGDLEQDELEDTLRMPAIKPVKSEAQISVPEDTSGNEKSAVAPTTQSTSVEPAPMINAPQTQCDDEKKPDEKQEPAEQEEESEDSEEPPSNKIIQLQARTPKIALQTSKNQTTPKKHRQRKGKGQTGDARASGDHQAQAN